MEAENEAVEARHEELDGLPCLLAGRWTSALNDAESASVRLLGLARADAR